MDTWYFYSSFTIDFRRIGIQEKTLVSWIQKFYKSWTSKLRAHSYYWYLTITRLKFMFTDSVLHFDWRLSMTCFGKSWESAHLWCESANLSMRAPLTSTRIQNALRMYISLKLTVPRAKESCLFWCWVCLSMYVMLSFRLSFISLYKA